MSNITRHANNAIGHFEDELDKRVLSKVITTVWNVLLDRLVHADGAASRHGVDRLIANYINKTI